MTTKTIWRVLAIVLCSLNSFSQDFSVNRIYQDGSGSPVFNPILNQFGIQWSRSIECPGGEIITVGHTYVAGQGENVYLIKRDPDGNIIWQTNQDVAGNNNNDYGINVYEAVTGDIYVCGTTDNGGSTNYDGVIMRFNSSGALVSSTTYPGTSGMNDIATALMIHPITGNLIVALTNENPTTSYDYMVLELNPSSLAVIGTPGTYDYANLIDIASGIEIDASSGDILLIGGSQSSLISSAYAVAIYNSSLAFISDARTDLVGTPNDQPLAYKKDASNNLYITGKTLSGTTYNIRTVKINANYTIAWNVTLDVNGLDDIGNTIDLDPTNGNVIIGGLCTRSGNITDMICQRYNGSTGAAIGSPFIQQAQNNTGNAAIKKLVTSPTGNVYFVAGEKGNSGLMQVLVGRLNASSTSNWQRQIVHPSQDILPSDIEWTTDGIFAISVLDSTTDEYLMTGYEEASLDTTRKYKGGKPFCKERELLVSFLPTAMNKSAVDNSSGTGIREFGDLQDWLTPTAFSTVMGALEERCRDCKIQAFRVFEEMKTTDTVAISRLGEYVPVPNFWSTLLLKLPNSITISQAQSILDGLKSIVACSQPNNFIEYMSPPNDSLYSYQKGLHLVGALTNAHINVEDAWNVQPNCGSSFVKGGIFDTGVNYKHKDLGYNGTASSGKVDGWFFNSALTGGGQNLKYNGPGPVFNYWDYDWLDHGTKVAGIIGALRNNTSGIAGIAGGDAANGNPGVKLYSLNTLGNANEEMKRLIRAIKSTALGDGSTPYAFKIHFANHSYKANGGWSFPDSIPIYNQQIHFANRMQVTQVASRGNYYINDNTLPATYDSCMIISVGASDANGNKMALSCYGSGMDIIAPGDTSIVQSISRDTYYAKFSGTSAAAPFASGVVALLMAHMNDSTDNYYNLAPEDCDYIIGHSATDVGASGYDSINGYGRLNAGKALRMVEKPVRILHHYGTNTKFPYTMTKSVYSNSDTIKLTESYKNYSNPSVVFPTARYVVKTYQIDATVSHIYTYPTDSFMYKWERHSSSYTYPLPDAQKRLNMHERCFFTAFSGTSASLRGYVYQVWDTIGNFKGWWPCDTSFNALYGVLKPNTLMEYSFLNKNKAVGVEEHTKGQQIVSVFPNPSSNEQTIVIDNQKNSDCTVEMYDVMGRLVKIVYSGKIGIGKTSIRNSLVNLPNSVYFYLVKLDEERISLKVIKSE